LFPDLMLLPVYHWDRIVIVPKDHPLAVYADKEKGALTIEALAEYPQVTYVFSLTGESSFKKAFVDVGLEPDVVFTARDADIIKTYVRMGMGVGVVAAMAWECNDKDDLVAIDARGLFPQSTTWIGFRRDTVLRGYMAEFTKLFAPHLTGEILRKATATETQEELDAVLNDLPLPLRGGCNEEFAAEVPD